MYADYISLKFSSICIKVKIFCGASRRERGYNNVSRQVMLTFTDT